MQADKVFTTLIYQHCNPISLQTNTSVPLQVFIPSLKLQVRMHRYICQQGHLSGRETSPKGHEWRWKFESSYLVTHTIPGTYAQMKLLPRHRPG